MSCTTSGTSLVAGYYTIDLLLATNVNTLKVFTATISNIKNPRSSAPVSPGSIICKPLTSAGASIVTLATLSTSISYTSNTITSVLLTSSSSINGFQSALWTITLPIVNDILSNGKIRIKIPIWEQYYTGSTSSATQMATSGQTCTVSQTGSLTSGCTMTVTATSPPNIVYLTGFTTTDWPSSQGTVTVTLSNVLNPASFRPFTNIEVYTEDSSGYVIDQQTTLITLIMSTTSIFGASSSVSITANTQVGDQGTYEFALQLANPLPLNSVITISFDSSITVLYNILTLSCNSGCYNSFDTVTGVSGVYSFTIQANYLLANSILIFSITGFVNPLTTTAAFFQITSYEKATGGTSYAVDSISTLSITATPGSLSISSVAVTDITRIYELPSSYTIKFSSTVGIATTYSVSFTFPSDFTVNSGSCAVSGLNSGYTCLATSSTNTIKISNIVSSQGTAGSIYTFTVTNVKNPGTYTTPGTISAILQTSGNIQLASGSYTFSSYYVTKSFVEQFTVTPMNSQAGNYPSTYTFQVLPRAKVSLGSYLEITFPSDITIPDENSVTCTPTLGFTNSRLSYRFPKTNIIQVSKGFSNSASTGDPPTLTFTISGIRNPRTSQITSKFSLTMYDGNGVETYSWNSTIAPTVQMTGTVAPQIMLLDRGSQQNGALTTYQFTIRINNYYQDGDIITLTVPSSVSLSEVTQCLGKSNLASTLKCSMSSDLKTATITVSSGSRRMLATINTGSTIAFALTNVFNPQTLQPSSSSFSYIVKTSSGYALESLSSGLTVTNSQAGTLSYTVSGVSVSNYIQDQFANYSISFVPKNYQQSMQIVITVPQQLGFPSSNIIECIGNTGVDTPKLNCITDQNKRTIIITNAFTQMRNAPYNVSFTLNSLKNPTNKSLTDSFSIQTFTNSNPQYAIDELKSNLSINFACNYPCKSCDSVNPDLCTECYSTVKDKWLYQSKCLIECPIFYYQDITNNTCNKCQIPCLQCSGSTDQCTSCISGYTLKINTCSNETTSNSTEKTKIKVPYIFPFAIVSILFILITFIGMCCNKETRFRETVIALVSIPEILSWGALAYFYRMHLYDGFLFLLVFGACLGHIVFNIIYCIVHQCKMIQVGSSDYKVFLQRYHGCHSTTMIFAFLFSFKFHHLILSRFAGGGHLKGTFNNADWRIWNAISIAYILTSYAALMFAGTVFFLKYYDQFLQIEYYDFVDIHFLTIEACGISTFITVLLLVGMCCTCKCGKDLEITKIKPKQNDEKYNRVADEPSSLENSQSEIMRRRVGPQINEEDLDDDIELNKRNRRRHLIDIELTDEEEQSSRRKETDPLTAKDKNRSIAMQRESNVLDNLTNQLRDERELLRDEKKMMLKERQRLMKEREQQQQDFKNLQQELKEDRQMVKKEKDKLERQREEFLNEIENRIQRKLEDWDSQSIGSARTKLMRSIVPNQQQNQDIPITVDKPIQTIKRMNEVDFSVQVGSENQFQTQQRAYNEKQKRNNLKVIQENEVMGAFQEDPDNYKQSLNPIKEASDEEDVLKEADEVLNQQEQYIKPTISLQNKAKPFFERVQGENKTKESRPEQFINQKPLPYFKYEEDIEGSKSNKLEQRMIIPKPIFEQLPLIENEQSQKESYYIEPLKHVFEIEIIEKEKDQTQQNFFQQPQKVIFESFDNNQREKNATQQQFYNPNKAIFELDDGIKTKTFETQQIVQNQRAIFSRDKSLRETSQNEIFQNSKPVYEQDEDQREKNATQQQFFSNQNPVFGYDDGQREMTATKQEFFQNKNGQFGYDDAIRDKESTRQDFYNNNQPFFEQDQQIRELEDYQEQFAQDNEIAQNQDDTKPYEQQKSIQDNDQEIKKKDIINQEQQKNITAPLDQKVEIQQEEIVQQKQEPVQKQEELPKTPKQQTLLEKTKQPHSPIKEPSNAQEQEQKQDLPLQQDLKPSTPIKQQDEPMKHQQLNQSQQQQKQSIGPQIEPEKLIQQEPIKKQQDQNQPVNQQQKPQIKEELLKEIEKDTSRQLEQPQPQTQNLQQQPIEEPQLNEQIKKSLEKPQLNEQLKPQKVEEELVNAVLPEEESQIEQFHPEEVKEKLKQLPQIDSLDEIPMNEPDQQDDDFYNNEDQIRDEVNKEIIAEDLEKEKDFVKKKKKVLYSDKSESSIDEMMEDTPSNYNIPNGRLDGKSLGLKALLLQAKKQGININQTQSPSPGYNNSITPEMQNPSSKTPILLQTNRLSKPPKFQQDEERKFVNNLFKDSNQQLNKMVSPQQMQMPSDQLAHLSRARNYAPEQSSEQASWRAFNQPMGRPIVIDEQNNSNLQEYYQDNQNSGLEFSDEQGIRPKKKKKIAAHKMFKEPPPNQDKIKNLQSAYMNNIPNAYPRISQKKKSNIGGFTSPQSQITSQPGSLPKIGQKVQDQVVESNRGNKLMQNNYF